MSKKIDVEVDLKDLGNGKYEMGEVRTNKKMELIKYMKEFQEKEEDGNCYVDGCDKKPDWLVSFRESNDPIMCISLPSGTFKMCSEHEKTSRKCSNYIKSIKIRKLNELKMMIVSHGYSACSKYLHPIDDELVNIIAPPCIKQNNGCGNCEYVKPIKIEFVKEIQEAEK